MSVDNPFLLPPRSVISFSGGRTSGLMLRRVLDAFGGKLPDDRKVIFENTGKEREETLVFIEECSQRWGVPIIWLEYRWQDGHGYRVVSFESASRKGEPFLDAIVARNYLPNPVTRFCTVELKLRTQNRFVRESLGWDKYTNAVGLRADESKRVAKMTGRQRRFEMTLFGEEKVGKKRTNPSTGETPLCPLAQAGVTLEDVTAFWASQPFDLQLRQDEGNCDLCFLKGAAKLVRIIRERPELADWWIEAEQMIESKSGLGTFRADRPRYAELKLIATDQQTGPGWLWSDNGNSGSCGEIDECRCTD